ncbi:MAG: M81 family metallopeptidase [Lutisporaceae bacterium]
MKRILIAEFKHETNSFAPDMTGEEEFRARDYLFGKEIIDRFQGAKNEIGAFIDYYAGRKEYELLPVLAFNAQPGGIVTKDVFETAKRKLLEVIKKEEISGILLALHGAMVVDGYQDGEGELLSTIREVTGHDIPIIASLDLHANVTKKMVSNATALFPYDYYPHTDTYDAGFRAAECMDKTLNGEINPTMSLNQLDLLLPYMPTSGTEMERYVKLAQSMRKTGEIYNVNICHGFFSADIYEQGMSVIAITNNDTELAMDIATKLGHEIWDNRHNFKRKFYTIDEAIDDVLSTDEGPFVFADVADNPGSGATGDSTGMLRRLLERKVKKVTFATIYDPETVEQAVQAGIGQTIHVKLGGKLSPDITGGPIECEAYVKAVTDGIHFTKDYCPGTLTNLGKSAVLVIDDIHVIVSTFRTQAWDLEAFRINGLTPTDFKVIAVKSAVHYRASYGTIAYKMMDIELPAIAPQNPDSLVYKHTRRPIFPLDNI